MLYLCDKTINSKNQTLDNKEQQDLAMALFPFSPLSSIHCNITSIPPFSDIDLQISSCGKNSK